MILHKDKENFEIAINVTSRYFNVSPAIVEKDYFVTLVKNYIVWGCDKGIRCNY